MTTEEQILAALRERPSSVHELQEKLQLPLDDIKAAVRQMDDVDPNPLITISTEADHIVDGRPWVRWQLSRLSCRISVEDLKLLLNLARLYRDDEVSEYGSDLEPETIERVERIARENGVPFSWDVKLGDHRSS